MRRIMFILLIIVFTQSLANDLSIHLADTYRGRQACANRVFFVPEDTDLADLNEVCNLCPYIPELAKQRSFIGKAQSVLLVPIIWGQELCDIMLVGLGKPRRGQQQLELEAFRRAVGAMVRETQKEHITQMLVTLPNADLFGCKASDLAKELGVIATMAQHKYDRFLNEKEPHNLTIQLYTESLHRTSVQKSLFEGIIIGKGVNTARYLIDTPANVCTPTYLAGYAHRVAETHGLHYTVFDEEQVRQMGMGGLSAVSQGSDQECRFVIMKYHYADKAPTICLAGKGVTHDAGGLNVKMHAQELMKLDMGGAGAIIGAMQALAQLRPKVNIVALLPMTENLCGSKAFHPGDILRFYNGKTAEIKNTDAEGRLILADALSYGVKHYKPDAIIDLATLTGACISALGRFYIGLMSEDEWLVDSIVSASKRCGDRVWRLPLHPDYKPAINSPIADMTNLGTDKYRAHATTAGIFLQQFVGDTPWAHFDIAGSCYNVPDIPYVSEGASGAGVRLLVDLIRNWK